MQARPDAERRRTTWLALGLLLVFAALASTSGRALDQTADERLLWRVGGLAVAGDWEVIETCLQGPLPLYLNQLLIRADSAAPRHVAGDFGPTELCWARQGMVLSGLMAGWLVFRLARRLWGDRGGLLALASFALHPLMWSYSALVAVDMTHAAFTLLALDAVLAHGRDPRLWRVGWAGATLGLAVATKYLALLIAPVAGLFVLLRVGRRAAGAGRARLVAALILVLSALVALHAAYGFRAGVGMTDPAVSAPLSRALEAPIIAQVLGLLPTPMLRGLDYQLDTNASVPTTYFAGRYDAGHPLYHLVGVMAKTPLAMLLAGALVLLLGVPRFLARGAPAQRREAVALLLAVGLVCFAYLSLFVKLQVGIRYVLPLFPMGLILLGGLGAVPQIRDLSDKTRRALVGVYLACCVCSTLLAWPNGLGYFNAAVGGPARAWMLYTDSNADWGQERGAGLEAVRARHPGVTALGRGGGPRLGRVAIYVRFRAPRDPEDPSRARHWLDPFEPLDHQGAAWLVYDVTPETWRAAAGADARARRDLAVALLGDGRLVDAAEQIEGLPPDRALLPTRILELLRPQAAGLTASDATGLARTLAESWIAVGRADRALSGLEALDGQGPSDPALALTRAQALLRLERLEEAVSALESAVPAPELRVAHTLFLAELYRRTLRLDDGIELLERELSSLPPGSRRQLQDLLERFSDQRDRWQMFLERP